MEPKPSNRFPISFLFSVAVSSLIPLLAIVFLFWMEPTAHAFIPTLSTSGSWLRWQGRKSDFAGNATNRSGLNSTAVFQAVSRGLQRWKEASTGIIQFDYWQGTDRNVYLTNSDYNGLSSVYFASNGGPAMDPNVIGLTQVWFNTNTGEILEADVELNDVNFTFSTDPRATSGYGSGGTTGRTVFLENVVTHELGHAFGMAHSGALQSSMLYMESPEQAHLGCDDQVGIRNIYGSPYKQGAGAISGVVMNSSGSAPVYGAQVVAISRTRGVALGSAITNSSGAYTLNNLEPDEYYLMAEPYYAGTSTLPQAYSGMNTAICSGAQFRRTFLTASGDSSLQEVHVGSSQTAQPPSLRVQCGSDTSSPKGGGDILSAPVIGDGASGENGFGFNDRFARSGQTLYYRLNSVAGRLDVHVLAYSLYAPVRLNVELQDGAGNPVQASIQNPTFFGSSGYVNYDVSVSATGLSNGVYFLKVTGSSLSYMYYPAGRVALDSSGFFLITGRFNGTGSNEKVLYPENGRCNSSEKFTDYQSPGGNPPRASTNTSNTNPADGGFLGFCGTVSQGGNIAPPGGASASGIVGWFVPWILMGAIPFGFRRRGTLSPSARL